MAEVEKAVSRGGKHSGIPCWGARTGIQTECHLPAEGHKGLYEKYITKETFFFFFFNSPLDVETKHPPYNMPKLYNTVKHVQLVYV